MGLQSPSSDKHDPTLDSLNSAEIFFNSKSSMKLFLVLLLVTIAAAFDSNGVPSQRRSKAAASHRNGVPSLPRSKAAAFDLSAFDRNAFDRAAMIDHPPEEPIEKRREENEITRKEVGQMHFFASYASASASSHLLSI